MIEVYRGSINTWECDEMGHMNVRFYVAKMMEGLAEFAHVAGLTQSFRPRARSTLTPRDQHIRFIREAHAGKPFTMTACVLDVTETSVLLYQQIDHATGEVCAAYRTWIDHVDVDTHQPFPWSAATLAAFDRLKDTPPAETAPRSLDLTVAPRTSARMADAHPRRDGE
jgi:acyl-CoA thioester hydrolase